jgi:hypothetical protein
MIEKKIESMEELIYTLNEFPNNYIFRGHSNQSWKLESTLERILGDRWTPENASLTEKRTIELFRSKFHLYDFTNKEPSSKLQWISLMQHYGVPTRLLDFTESPYIALYFSIESFKPSSESNFVIYAIDFRNLLKESISFIKQKDKEFTYEYLDILSKQDEIFQEIIDRFSYDILWVTEPTEGNWRLDRQAGCFLTSCNLGKKIEEIILLDIYQNVDIQKIIIPNNFYTHIYTLLKKTNITSKALFGDLSGLGKSIQMELCVYFSKPT